MVLLGQYFSGNFQNIISSLYSYSKQCHKFTEQNNEWFGWKCLTRRELRIMLISAFAFVSCYFLLFDFQKKINILTKETNVNECNERQRLERLERSKNDSFEWETKIFNFFFEKFNSFFFNFFLAFLAFEWYKQA